MRILRRWLILFPLAMTLPVAALMLPMRIPFQGKLINPSDNSPKNGSATMIFTIYNDPTASAPANILYTETQTVTVTNGVFSVQIGTVTLLTGDVFSGTSAYLGITVDADAEMAPRQPLSMSPYAYTAGQLVQDGDIRINPGFTYSTFTATGNLALQYGVAGTTATFMTITSTNVGTFGVIASSGISMLAGTMKLAAASRGIDATGTGIVASTGKFTQGITITGNAFSVGGASFTVAGGSATVGYGLTADSFAGDGGNLTNVVPSVYMSSSTRSPNLVGGTEKVINYSTVTFTNSAHKAFIMGRVAFGNVAGTGNVKVRVSALGGACGVASTLVHTARWGTAVTATIQLPVTIFALDSRGATGTFTYCLTALGSGAHTYFDHDLAVMFVSGQSTTGVSP